MFKIRRLGLNTKDFTKQQIFSDKCYAKDFSKEFLNAAREENILLCEHYLQMNKFLIYDFDDVHFPPFSSFLTFLRAISLHYTGPSRRATTRWLNSY
jgi:hypothetical protein